MAASRQVTGGAAARAGDALPTIELLNAALLKGIARHELTPREVFQIGVFLKIEPSVIEQLADTEEDAVAYTIKMLDAWLDSRKTASSATILYDELSAAFLSIRRADLLDFVRCDQLRTLNGRLRKAKETAQTCKRNFNEQMRRAKVDFKKTKEDLEGELRLAQDEVRRLNKLLQRHGIQASPAVAAGALAAVAFPVTPVVAAITSPAVAVPASPAVVAGALAAVAFPVALTSPAVAALTSPAVAASTSMAASWTGARHVPKQSQSAVKTPDRTDDWIKALTAASKPVHGESGQDKSLRALRVMSMIRQHGMPELWRQVSQHFVDDGTLDMRRVVTRTNLQELVYLLSSRAASDDIQCLLLDFNRVFEDDDTARQLAAAVAKMSQLRELSLDGCFLTDGGFEAIAGGVTEHLTKLTFDSDNLTDAIDVTVRNLLSRRPRLKIRVSPSSLSSLSLLLFRRLVADFPDRFF